MLLSPHLLCSSFGSSIQLPTFSCALSCSLQPLFVPSDRSVLVMFPAIWALQQYHVHAICWRQFSCGVCVCVLSCSFGDLLSFTLTAFVELMDHGIVSWDTFSVAFIKKVSPEKCLLIQNWENERRCVFTTQAGSLTPSAPSLADRQLREQVCHGHSRAAAVLGHPGVHGAQQSGPLLQGGTRDHHRPAHPSSSGVRGSVFSHKAAKSQIFRE